MDIIRFKKTSDTAIVPSRAHADDAGMDLYSDETLSLAPGERQAVSTGISMALPRGYEGQVRPRSGNALKLGLGVLNSPGTIDAGFRDTVKVILINLGLKPVSISRGDRIAQLVVARCEFMECFEVDNLEETERGTGGFGSTGK